MSHPGLDEHSENLRTDQSRIARTLQKHSLMGHDDALPKPFHSQFGEMEQVYSYFFQLNQESIIVAKLSTDPSRESVLWDEVEQFRTQNFHPALLPIPGNTKADGVLIYEDGRTAADILRKLGLLKGATLPKPHRVLTGLAGYSRLYIFSLPRLGDKAGSTVLVKFDRPDRISYEWEAISRLREAQQLPKELQLPFPENNSADGVIVSPMFQTQIASGDALQLSTFLQRHLFHKPEYISKALDLLVAFLIQLYADRSPVYTGLAWKDIYNDLLSSEQELATLFTEDGAIGDARQPDFLLKNFTHAGIFTNPLSTLHDHLNRDLGKQFRAMAHGDLQSTNILLGLSDRGTPERVAIIDLEKMRPDQLVLEDVARIEADFWRSVFTTIARDQFPGRPEEEVILATMEAFVIATTSLDGLHPRIKAADPEVLRLAKAARDYVFELRKRLWGLLGTDQRPYWPFAYFLALKFYFLRSLLRALVQQDKLRLRIVILASSMIEETLRGLNSFSYPIETYRSESPMPAPGADEHGATTNSVAAQLSPTSSRLTPGALGPATSVFGSPGLIQSATQGSISFHQGTMILNPLAGLDPEGLFSFADTERLINLSGVLNAQAFRKHPWWGTSSSPGYNILEKSERNRSHIRKNPYTLLLIKAFKSDQFEPRDEYIGFSHVIPLSREGHEAYCRGHIPDNFLGPEVICAPGQPARSLLLFSIAADTRSFRNAYPGFQTKQATLRLKYQLAAVLIRALGYHISKMMSVQGDAGFTELIAQNDNDKGVLNALEFGHFRTSDLRSGDHYAIRTAFCRKP
jgi:hypothetical protein